MSNPWLKFYPSDWRADPVLRMVGLHARGLWIEMLCLMSEAEPRGVLLVNGRAITSRQLASLVGASPREVEASLTELEDAGVFSRDEDGAIYSRRMRRDAVKAERDRANGKTGGNPKLKREGVNPQHNPKVKGEDKAQKPDARSQKPETNLRSVETADAGPTGEKMILDLIEAIGPVGARDGVLSPAGLKPIMRLLDAGCDFDADVLPAVREQCAKLNEPLRTLDAGFLRDAIHERRAARAKGAKPAAKQVFVIKDTPEWQAWADHLARTGQPLPKAMPSSAGEGRYFPSQLPAPEALH